MKTNRPMSGEEMVLSSSKTNLELPSTGVKYVTPTHSWLEQKQIQSLLDHRKTLLDVERVERENNLMVAEWIPEKHKAAVKRKGKHWEAFGHHSDNTDWFFPEEALFLMETNCLQCLYGEVPLSIQKGYSVLLKHENGCSLTEYRVFAHLCRLGYRVLRHQPNLTVTAYERSIRLDQHLKQPKTFGDTSHADEQMSEETVTKKIPVLNKQDEIITGKTQLLNKPEAVVLDKTPRLDKSEETVTGNTQVTENTVTRCVGKLTKRKLWELQMTSVKLNGNYMSLPSSRKYLEKRKFDSLMRKYENRADNVLKDISMTPDEEDDTPEIPSERWQPPIVITDLPENIEITMGATPIQAEGSVKDQGAIEVIDIADTSSEEPDTDQWDSDSDIEIIQEIRLPPQIKDSEEEEDEEDDDLEIIEVPVPKKEIPVETLSSDSEEEKGEEEESGSDSERSYDGNWKRGSAKKRTQFVRPPTMSHLTYSAVDEFCLEKKSLKANVNGEASSNRDGNNSSEFISLEVSESGNKRPTFVVEQSRNEILDLMPTMAGQNRKLMTLNSPDLRLIPDSILPKQPSYTYSTNALRARVFRQGFRGRRNFHGPRFATSFNPYYNNTNGNFFLNQIGRFEGLFQPPQMSQVLGGGDINSVARGVMQIASALLMNLPQNNMNNGFPYNSRSHFPLMNSHLSQIEAPNPVTPQFPLVGRNFSYNEQSNINPQGFNMSQRNNTEFQHLFDMPQQRNFGTPNHTRFSDNSTSPVAENYQNNPNFNVDLNRSSESDFDSSDHNFRPTPHIGNGHRAGRNFRNNRAANFRSRRGRFKGKTHRGGFPPQVSRGRPLNHSQLIDPAYIKPDVPIPGEENSVSQGIADFIPISYSNSDKKPVEIISIDDIDDECIPKRGSSEVLNKKERKRKNKKFRKKENAKRNRLSQNLGGVRDPEIVFLDSPTVSRPSHESMSESIKQENETDVLVKTETNNSLSNLKREVEATVAYVKWESTEGSLVKVENEAETRVKMEGANPESSGVRVKVEQEGSGQNVRVESKIESSSFTSSVVSLPLANLVKEEPSQMKLECVEGAEVKSEAVDVIESVKRESLDEQESKEAIFKLMDQNDKVDNVGETSGRTQAKPMDTSVSEFDRTKESENESDPLNRTNGNLEMDVEREEKESCDEVSSSRTDLTSEDKNKKVSSWAEVKEIYRHLLSTYQEGDSEDESEEDDDEIRPILKPKHCKTIGTLLSALKISTLFNSPQPEDVLRLKISFDLYHPTESRKSNRGLPQYRIVVFSGTEPLPSPAQLREVNSRFQDSVPVLTAVVTPSTVLFYIFSNIDLPQDTNSYTNNSSAMDFYLFRFLGNH